jgi:hypothetical protein
VRTKKILVLVLVFLLGIFIGRFIFSDKTSIYIVQDEMERQSQRINDLTVVIEQLCEDLERVFEIRND